MFGNFLAFVVLEVFSFNIFIIFALVSSLFSLVIFVQGISYSSQSNLIGDIDFVNQSIIHILQIILLPVICFMITYASYSIKNLFYPELMNYIRSGSNVRLDFENNYWLLMFKGKLDQMYKQSKGFEEQKGKDTFELCK